MSADRACSMPEASNQNDRRRRYRACVHWRVQFHIPAASSLLASETQNLSSDGFYCRLNTAFAPGEIIDCTLEVPAHRPQAPEGTLAVDCKVRIVRVDEPDSHGLYGVGCRIEDYHFPSAPPPAN